MKPTIERLGVSLILASMIGLILWPALDAVMGVVSIPVAVLLGGLVGGIALRRLPAGLDGAFQGRRVLTVLWCVLALVTVVQTARLSAYMQDASRDWVLTTQDAFWAKHMCMTAYFYAADLNRQGEENVYDPAHYPGLTPDAENRTTLANLVPEDPYQYPPQFLLLPRLAIALSNDFFTIRPVWYALQALFFLVVALSMARWYGGVGGQVALWLVPAIWISVPAMLNFQYGQFHLTTIALAVAAFLALERKRDMLGGALLAAAILAKGFPGIVLIPLLLQRRWRPIAWTGAWAAGITVVSLGVLGPEVFVAFVSEHLPRLRDGSAFAFEEAWPELRAALLAGNVSPFAMVRKLSDLGLTALTDNVARVVQLVFTLGVVAMAVVAARVRGARARALVWFALLNLGAMTSPAAWGDYVPVGTLWMLTLVAAGTTRVRPAIWGTLAGLSFLLPGVVPLGNWPSPVVAMGLSIAATLAWIGFNGWVVVRAGARDAVAARDASLEVSRIELQGRVAAGGTAIGA